MRLRLALLYRVKEGDIVKLADCTDLAESFFIKFRITPSFSLRTLKWSLNNLLLRAKINEISDSVKSLDVIILLPIPFTKGSY